MFPWHHWSTFFPHHWYTCPWFFFCLKTCFVIKICMFVSGQYLKGKCKMLLHLCLFLSFFKLKVLLCLLLTWQVVPQLSCPLALFSYYNPILKRGVQKFMSTIKDVGVHGNSCHVIYPIASCMPHMCPSCIPVLDVFNTQ